MIIHIVNAEERKGEQQWKMVRFCKNHWQRLNNANYQNYIDVMNIKTRKYNGEHNCCYVSTSYHFNPNKW